MEPVFDAEVASRSTASSAPRPCSSLDVALLYPLSVGTTSRTEQLFEHSMNGARPDDDEGGRRGQRSACVPFYQSLTAMFHRIQSSSSSSSSVHNPATLSLRQSTSSLLPASGEQETKETILCMQERHRTLWATLYRAMDEGAATATSSDGREMAGTNAHHHNPQGAAALFAALSELVTMTNADRSQVAPLWSSLQEEVLSTEGGAAASCSAHQEDGSLLRRCPWSLLRDMLRKDTEEEPEEVEAIVVPPAVNRNAPLFLQDQLVDVLLELPLHRQQQQQQSAKPPSNKPDDSIPWHRFAEVLRRYRIPVCFPMSFQKPQQQQQQGSTKANITREWLAVRSIGRDWIASIQSDSIWKDVVLSTTTTPTGSPLRMRKLRPPTAQDTAVETVLLTLLDRLRALDQQLQRQFPQNANASSSSLASLNNNNQNAVNQDAAATAGSGGSSLWWYPTSLLALSRDIDYGFRIALQQLRMIADTPARVPPSPSPIQDQIRLLQLRWRYSIAPMGLARFVYGSTSIMEHNGSSAPRRDNDNLTTTTRSRKWEEIASALFSWPKPVVEPVPSSRKRIRDEETTPSKATTATSVEGTTHLPSFFPRAQQVLDAICLVDGSNVFRYPSFDAQALTAYCAVSNRLPTCTYLMVQQLPRVCARQGAQEKDVFQFLRQELDALVDEQVQRNGPTHAHSALALAMRQELVRASQLYHLRMM